MTTLPLLIFIFELIFHILGEAQSPVCSGAGGPVSQCPPGCKCIEGIVDCRQVYTVKKRLANLFLQCTLPVDIIVYCTENKSSLHRKIAHSYHCVVVDCRQGLLA